MIQPQHKNVKSAAPKSSLSQVDDKILPTILPYPIAVDGAQNIRSTSPSPRRERVAAPGFILKLYRMLNDKSLSHLIYWSSSGTTFVVPRPEEFARRILPAYFKHSNFSSFVRQLNMYGFRKVQQMNSGITAGPENPWEFTHDDFIRDRPEKMVMIKRKITKDEDLTTVTAPIPDPSHLGGPSVDAINQTLSRLYSELRSIREHQVSIQNELSTIQAENQKVWRENQLFRNRANQQQEVIDRIIRFLASMFSGPETARNLVMPDFLNNQNIQNVLQMYQNTGGLPDTIYPTVPTPMATGQKRPLPLTWDTPTGLPNRVPHQKTLTDLGTSFANQAHDLDDIQDQLNNFGDIFHQSDRNPEDLDISQYLDDYPAEDEFLVKDPPSPQ